MKWLDDILKFRVGPCNELFSISDGGNEVVRATKVKSAWIPCFEIVSKPEFSRPASPKLIADSIALAMAEIHAACKNYLKLLQDTAGSGEPKMIVRVPLSVVGEVKDLTVFTTVGFYIIPDGTPTAPDPEEGK